MDSLARFSAAAVALALASPCLAADKPTSEEIAKARADCHMQETRLERLEHDASWCTGDARLLQVRDAAEHSCGRAEDLMIAAGMEPKPFTPRPAPPVPTITVTEKVRTGAAMQTAAAEPEAQFAAMEVDRRCDERRGASH